MPSTRDGSSVRFSTEGPLLEFFGGLALIAGTFVTVLSALFIVHMTIGIFLVHLAQGFYVVGPGQGGMEFNLLVLASLLTLVEASRRRGVS